MINSLKDFIYSYCIIDEYGENYIKFSKFYDCYKNYCHDNGVVMVDDIISILEEYNVEIIIMNKEKWLKGIKFQDEVR